MSKVYRGAEKERLFYLRAHDILCNSNKNVYSVSKKGMPGQRDTHQRTGTGKSNIAGSPRHNKNCFYFQQVVSRRTGTECSCRAEMDMTFCSISCPYATNAPMSKDPVMIKTYGRWCG